MPFSFEDMQKAIKTYTKPKLLDVNPKTLDLGYTNT